MMSKRIKYVLSSVLSAIGFYSFITLPYESRYYGLMVGIVLIVFCFWFGLGIIFTESFYVRMMSIILPVSFFVGFGLFAVLLPTSLLGTVILSIVFGIIAYAIFLVENVFLVTIGYRTPPLYRAAYTMSLIIMLLSSFFLFNSLFSFKLIYWLNAILVFMISALIFLYQFYGVSIELADDGKGKNITAYTLVPALLMSQVALVFSFWPVGIFKGSIYLVAMIYIISGLIQADVRERLFRRTWLSSIWIGVAIILGIILTARWR